MPLLKQSLKHKLIGVILISSVATSLLTYAALLGYEFYSFRQGTARSVSAMARLIASNSSAALIYDDKALAEENLAALRSEPDIAMAALYDREGHLYAVYSTGHALSPPPATPGPDAMVFHDGGLSLFYPVMQEQQRAGTLFIESDLSEMYARFRVYGGVLLIVLGGSMAVSLFLSNFFQRRISEPILDLARMARIISEQKNYSIRASSRSDDELGDLTSAFNAMLDQIQLSHTEVERARDEAVAAAHAKDDFLAALSHELRTPLNPVLLLASDAATRPDLPAAIRADFDTIRKNVELEARLIDDLLDLTRITRDKLILDRRLVDPEAVLKDAIATVRGEAETKGIALTLDVGPGRPRVWGDPIRLQQIFWNVLKNAVKFTPEGGRVAVSVRTEAAAGQIFITIADNGIGLTDEELPRLFQVFSQGEHAEGGPHRFGGLGLGLAISQTLAQLHDGTIRASSAGRDRGSTFVVELPLAAVPADAVPDPTPSVEPVPTPPKRERRILLVEDHAPTRTVLALMLKRRGYAVAAAASLAEARAIVASEPIDILVSDIGLPDGSGYELMAEMAARRPTPGIALTGYGMEHDIAASLEAGFIAHLTKPVRIQMLDEALASIPREEGS